MDFKSKKTSFLILVVTALTCSRALFALFNDPEGPNLLVVTVMAVILFLPSFAAYAFNSSIVAGPKKLLLAISIQVLVTAGFYLWLR